MSVTVEARGAARVLWIAREARRNALDRATLAALAREARRAGRDREARGLVLAGRGETFAAGGDLQEFSRVKGAAGGRLVANAGHELIEALRAARMPLVAAVTGDAFGGGCELAAACDRRVVESHARFHWVQGKMGVTTGWGATARLVELVGPGVAAGWLLAARVVDAREAQAAGFVDEVVERGGAVDAACAWVDAVARVPRNIARLQLALLREATGLPPGEARVREQRAFARAWASPEHVAAVERFLARRAERG